MSRTFTASSTRTIQGGEDSYSIEYAKSGRSKCSACSKAIPHKGLRLGINSRWQHWSCVTDRTISSIGSADKLKGLAQLERKDQDMVRQRFAGGGGKAPRKVHTLFD